MYRIAIYLAIGLALACFMVVLLIGMIRICLYLDSIRPKSYLIRFLTCYAPICIAGLIYFYFQ